MKKLVLDRPANMYWIEYSSKLMHQEQIGQIIWNYELCLDKSSYCIFFYGIFVQLQPQEYNFLLKVLENGSIRARNLMGAIHKLKSPVKRKQDANTDNKEKANYLKDKIARMQAPYKILSRIKNKIKNEFVWDARQKYINPISNNLTNKLSEIVKTNDKKAEKVEFEKIKRTWIKQNKQVILKSYTKASNQNLKNFTEKYVEYANDTIKNQNIDVISPHWFMFPEYCQTGNLIRFDVERYVDLLISVKNRTFETSFMKGSLRIINKGRK